MKKNLLAILLGVFPIVCLAKAPNCFSWPMSMTEVWMKNTEIVDIKDLDESKTKITLMATEKKGKDLYTQIYHFIFYDKYNNSYEIITKMDSSHEECSISSVNGYLISKNFIIS
ncbi:hypothetical protein [Snodgrassella alvi]|uniref:hypothetical protein n=1 Tax=Snodgrassella alvi TaxID=1196083 RepID=UPI000C1F844C|nr:hypothetical protein [Snodgrassella alvi]PIT12881.1 hypothetical protein BGI33_12350 [Snodgrassella alvi]PIT17200.1 hypothetical protein BGI34_07945 [Snodgrassella alvi]